MKKRQSLFSNIRPTFEGKIKRHFRAKDFMEDPTLMAGLAQCRIESDFKICKFQNFKELVLSICNCQTFQRFFRRS